MPQILGNYIECDTSDHCEFLTINFSPTSIPIQQRWRNNGLSADFLADYLSTFFPGEDEDSFNRRAEIKDGVNFIANELLENAMKFNFASSKYPVRLYMKLKQDQVQFYITNSMDPSVVESWQRILKRLLTEDTHELFMEQIMKNEDEESDGSGLGYLTMINDWNAKLAWKFESAQDNPKIDDNVQKVTVMVYLPI